MFDLSLDGIYVYGVRDKIVIQATSAQLWWVVALVKHCLDADLVMIHNDNRAEFCKLDYCKDGTQTAILINELIEEQRILKRRHNESKTT